MIGARSWTERSYRRRIEPVCGFTRSTLLWLVSTTYSRPPLASSECGTPSGSQSRSGPHKGSFGTGLARMKVLMSAT